MTIKFDVADHQMVEKRIDAAAEAWVERSKVFFPSTPGMHSSAGIIRTLDRLGLRVPMQISAAAEKGDQSGVDRLVAAGVKYSVHEIDRALNNSTLDTKQRLYVKISLEKAGLLGD
jgi:hypothetical protein